MNVSPGGLAFSSNRTIFQSIGSAISSPGAFHFSKSLNLYVFGTDNGTIIFLSKNFEFELEVSSCHHAIKQVLVSDTCALTFFLTEKNEVGVVDVFREIEGVRIAPYHMLTFSSIPRSIALSPPLLPSLSTCLFIGLDSGKLMTLDVSAAAAMDTPRYIPSLFMDMQQSCPITAIAFFNQSHVLVGGSDGAVRIVRLEGKRIVATTPTNKLTPSPVVHIQAIETINVTSPSFLVTYENGSVCSFDLNTIISTTRFPDNYSIKRVFSTSVKPDTSCLIGIDSSSRLLRLDGPKWDHLSYPFPESTRCVAIAPLPSSIGKFLSLQIDGQGTTSVVELSLHPSNPLAPIVVERSVNIGTLSLGRFSGREPAVSVSFSRTNPKFEPNMIRLGNIFMRQPLAGSDRFLTDQWNAGTWEGMIVSAFNSPPELAFIVYSHTVSFVLGVVPLTAVPTFSIITAMDVQCDSSDRWSILLGFSSGRIGLVESYLDFPSPDLVWRTYLLPSNGVHEGNKICRLDRTVMDGRIVMALDSEGLCSFTRMTSDLVDEQEDDATTTTPPEHVVMTGENGTVFIDSKNHAAYACMSDGSVERIKTPRIRKSTGIVDMFDAETWDTVGVIEGGFPLSGKFINLYPQFGIAVREQGIILMTFPTKHTLFGGRITKGISVTSPILDSMVHLIGARCYLIVVTKDNSVQVFETSADGIKVFERNFSELKSFEYRVGKSVLICPSMHLVDLGKAITSFLFADRMKDIQSIEPIIAAAQRFLGFPKIKSSPLPEYGTASTTGSLVPRENTSSSASSSSSLSQNKPGKRHKLLGKLFGSSRKRDEKTDNNPAPPLPPASKFQPTESQVREARDQLAKNLEKMAKLQDDTDEMQMASEEFLKSCNELSETFDGGKKKSSRKLFGIKF